MGKHIRDCKHPCPSRRTQQREYLQTASKRNFYLRTMKKRQKVKEFLLPTSFLPWQHKQLSQWKCQVHGVRGFFFPSKTLLNATKKTAHNSSREKRKTRMALLFDSHPLKIKGCNTRILSVYSVRKKTNSQFQKTGYSASNANICGTNNIPQSCRLYHI